MQLPFEYNLLLLLILQVQVMETSEHILLAYKNLKSSYNPLAIS